MSTETRMVEQEETAAARQWHGTHLSMATNKHARIEELFSHC
jgi:hypothetical protein